MPLLNNSLKVFLSVAEHCSITKAANTLYISQPAVTKAIKSLEEELNVKLFYRDKKQGLLITDVGQKLLECTEQLIHLEDQIYQTACSNNNAAARKIRIGSVTIATTLYLSKALYAFKKEHPNITIEIQEGSSREIRKKVENHEIDFGIAFSPFHQLQANILFSDQMVAVTNRPPALGDTVDIRNASETLIFCRCGYEVIQDLLNEQHFPASAHHLIVENIDTLISMVKAGNGIGVLSEYVLSTLDTSFHRCTVEPPIQMDFGIVTNGLHELIPATVEFIKILEQIVYSS